MPTGEHGCKQAETEHIYSWQETSYWGWAGKLGIVIACGVGLCGIQNSFYVPITVLNWNCI